MQSFSAEEPARSPYSGRNNPKLTSFADEVCATVARLFAYVGVIALFGILGVHAWNSLYIDDVEGPTPPPAWSVADRSFQAFALNPPEGTDKIAQSDAYVILRPLMGGRKDILRWSGSGEKPAAELEIYRPGRELGGEASARAGLAARMLEPGAEFESAGVIESKFGSVALLRPGRGGEAAGSCLGFLKRIEDPALQISGWSCQGGSLPELRAAIDCMLNRLVLLTPGNEPKLAQYFARAERNRGSCAAATATADWVTDTANPRLRGAL